MAKDPGVSLRALEGGYAGSGGGGSTTTYHIPTKAETDAAAAAAALDKLQRAAIAEQKAAANAAAAETARAKASGKAQSVAENTATDNIVAGLLKSLAGYTTGRDTLIGSAGTVLDTTLKGILAQYSNAADDSEAYNKRNNMDFDSKSNANVQNRVRESTDLLSQVLSQGAGETDALKALSQATRAFDANAVDLGSSYNDTLRSINGQLNAAGSTAENGRLNAYQQNQEAISSAWNDYYKNIADTWTNIQRTEAGNNNVDGDYSVKYNPKYSQQAIDEISNVTGKVKPIEAPGQDWASNFLGRKAPIQSDARLGNQAAAVKAGPLVKAEGATLRKW